MKKISVVGLGKLGACMAAVYASKGYHVIGVDINEKFVSAINNGQAPVNENKLQDFISQNKENIEGTLDYDYAIDNSEITFIIVPTPTNEAGVFDDKYVRLSCESIGKSLKNKATYHLVVLTSTLLPEDCDTKVIPILEKSSGKKCGQDFGFCYSPEFIAIGSVIRDLQNPDFFLIGEFDQKSGGILEEFYHNVNSLSPVKRMSIPSAELTKISINSFLTMKITYANMLAEISEKISGINVDVVTDAIGHDKRIGSKYLKGGLGFGGPCFPRDNRAFSLMAAQRGVVAPFANNTDKYNHSIINRVTKIIKNLLDDGGSVGILGLSYKPGTYFVEESQAVNIAKGLVEDGCVVNVFESAGYEHAFQFLNNSVRYCDSMIECINKSSVILLTNLDENFKQLPSLLKNGQKVIDPWRQLLGENFEEDVVYFPLGVGKAYEKLSKN